MVEDKLHFQCKEGNDVSSLVSLYSNLGGLAWAVRRDSMHVN